MSIISNDIGAVTTTHFRTNTQTNKFVGSVEGEVEPILIEAQSINGSLEADRNPVENRPTILHQEKILKAQQQTRSNPTTTSSRTPPQDLQNTVENRPDARQQFRLNPTAGGASTSSRTRLNPGEAVPSTGLRNVSSPFNSQSYQSLLNRSRKQRHDDDCVANAIINAANAISKNSGQRTFIAPTAENYLVLYLEENLHILEGHFLISFVETTKRIEMTKLQQHFYN